MSLHSSHLSDHADTKVFAVNVLVFVIYVFAFIPSVWYADTEVFAVNVLLLVMYLFHQFDHRFTKNIYVKDSHNVTK